MSRYKLYVSRGAMAYCKSAAKNKCICYQNPAVEVAGKCLHHTDWTALLQNGSLQSHRTPTAPAGPFPSGQMYPQSVCKYCSRFEHAEVVYVVYVVDMWYICTRCTKSCCSPILGAMGTCQVVFSAMQIHSEMHTCARCQEIFEVQS